jgi:H+/Cl- antiporter ClcA
MTDQEVSELGKAIQEVTERVQLLVREEIALAQAEMTLKLQKLMRGIVAGAIAGIFALFGLIYLLHAASWGVWEILGTGNGPWLGFLIVTLLLFLLGAILGLLAFRFIKRATPPKPELAIQEAQLIRETVAGSQPEHSGTAVPEVPR